MKVLAVLFEKSPNDGANQISDVAEVLYRYSSQIALRDQEAIFMEVSKSMRLYRAESLTCRVQAHLRQFGLQARTALADDPATALSFARYFVRGGRKGELPTLTLLDYVSPFRRLDATEKNLFLRKIQLLERLGVRTLGRFLALPEKTIVNHLGGQMLTVYDAVQSSRDCPWPYFKPKEKVCEQLSLSERELTSSSLEGMSFLFKSLIDRSLARLHGRGERLISFKLIFDLEKNSQSEGQRIYKFDLSLPHSSVRDLLSVVRERVAADLQQKPLTSLVENLSLEVLEVAPAQSGQRDILNPKKQEENEAFRSLLSRIAEKIGSEKVFMAETQESYRPESSWRKTLKDLHLEQEELPVQGPRPQRPLRLLQIPLKVDPSWLAKVKVLDSPEVLSGEWWDKGFERIYFRVQAEQGEQFWVFRTKTGVYIHGAF